MRRTPRIAVLAVVLTSALSACSDDAPAASPDPTTGDSRNPTVRPELESDVDSVLVLGDSLTNGARIFGDLGDRLDAAGFEELEIVAFDGVDTPWGIAQVEQRAEVGEVVVVELGTNPDADIDGFEEQVAELVAALRERGAERIAWVTPVHGADDRYDEKVEILHAASDIDEVADWASVVRERPRRLAADGLHPTEAGYADLAEFLAETALSIAR